MYRKDGVEFYKHVETRRYLLLDSESRCYRQTGAGVFVEIDFEQALCVARASKAVQSWSANWLMSWIGKRRS